MDRPHMSRVSETATLPFYEGAFVQASPEIERIRKDLPNFSSPELRVQRVGQLDSHLLDQELADLLTQPVKNALRKVSPKFEQRYNSEILVALRLILYKFSIYDRGATYGAMLQNLKYRNEWAHRAHCTYRENLTDFFFTVHSTARDAPLSSVQLALHPLLTIILPYMYSKAKSFMSSRQYDLAPTESLQFIAYSLSEHWQRLWSLIGLVNFSLFLWNGKYRTVADRLLGMRLTYANRALHHNVSFEFLNRQLVWNAVMEFLLFIVPLVRPKHLFHLLTLLPKHQNVLKTLLKIMPTKITDKLSLRLDMYNNVEYYGYDMFEPRGKYWYLPVECCPLCFERLEREAGVNVHQVPIPMSIKDEVSIPTPDPLHPCKGLAARHKKKADKSDSFNENESKKIAVRAAKMAERRAARKGASSMTIDRNYCPTVHDTSPNGIRFLDALAFIPYATQGKKVICNCRYCYSCIGRKFKEELTSVDLRELGGWPCLRCGDIIFTAERLR